MEGSCESPRSDGRSPRELRPLSLEREYLKYPEGSVLIQLGDTKVICAVSVDERTPSWMKDSPSGWATAEYAMLPRATRERNIREVTRGRPSGRSQEIQRLIGRSLRSVLDLEALGSRTLVVDCDVIQADGGTRTAAVSGAFVAMVDALYHLMESGVLKKLPVTDTLAAVSVGLLDGEPLLDLCHAEDATAQVDMNVVGTGGGRIVEIQGTAEKYPFLRSELLELLDLASDGIARIVEAQRAALGERWTMVEEALAAARSDRGRP